MSTQNPKIEKMIRQALAEGTPEERLQAFLSIDATGLRGVSKLRERQKRVHERLFGIRQNKEVFFTPTDVSPFFKETFEALHKRYHGREEYCAARRSERDDPYKRAEGLGITKRTFWFAETYHRKVSRMYRSPYAKWVWGASEQETEWTKYGLKSRTLPGVLCTSGGICLYKKNDCIAFPAPPGFLDRQWKTPPREILLDGESWAEDLGESHGLGRLYRRWRWHSTHGWQDRGLGALLPDGSCEHGETCTEIENELAHKEQVRQERQERERLTQRTQRAARLVRKLCRNLIVTHEDARSVGFCKAGIEAFKAAHSISGDQATLGCLVEISKADTRVNALIDRVTSDVAFKIVQRRQKAASE